MPRYDCRLFHSGAMRGCHFAYAMLDIYALPSLLMRQISAAMRLHASAGYMPAPTPSPLSLMIFAMPDISLITTADCYVTRKDTLCSLLLSRRHHGSSTPVLYRDEYAPPLLPPCFEDA